MGVQLSPLAPAINQGVSEAAIKLKALIC